MEEKGRKCLTIKADVRQRNACFHAVIQTLKEFGKLNILINNAAFQKTEERLEDITEENLQRTKLSEKMAISSANKITLSI